MMSRRPVVANCAARRPGVLHRAGLPTRPRGIRLVARDAPETPTQVTQEASASEVPQQDAKAAEVAASSSSTPSAADAQPLPEGVLTYKEPSGGQKFWTSFKLAFALPWRRFKKDSVLVFKLEGEVSDQGRGRFDSGLSVPQICQALQKAALDPRIKGVAIEVGPLAAGWGKVQEIRRYLSYFRQSGKFTIAYMKQASEKEYYLASACQELYAPPSANVSLRGFTIGGTFLRGVLDKVGIEPQVKRIGKYKSAGDQLLRKDMSEAQAEQLGAILDDIYQDFLTTVAEARGKTKEEVAALIEEGVYEMEKLAADGWVSLKYEDEVIEELKARTGGKPDELRKVELRKYAKVSPSAFGLKGKKRIVVLRAAGAILGRSSGTSSGAITPDQLIPRLRALAKDKGVAAVVLRVDSPGGDALASDLMWREIKKLGEKKPVIASMGDVAASGGYYLSMACKKIVAEALTVTGSIGVVTGKFNASKFYSEIGYSKTLLSRGRYAELLADNRPFSPEEAELFDRSAQHAYESFRNKAAESRGMSVDAMQEVAQGRVWTGRQALEMGLVDALGGVHRAVAIAKQAAEIPEDEQVSVIEVGRAQASPLALLTGRASASASLLSAAMLLMGLMRGQAPAEAMAAAAGVTALAGGPGDLSGLPPVVQEVTTALMDLYAMSAGQPGRASYLMTDVNAASLGSSGSASAGSLGALSGSSSSTGFLDEGEGLQGPLEVVEE
eukprot:CAMPEP_0202909918 /NCGR_PEP_ID=MMETSP1392-20130828/50619_1 /ASSEMBLY_ACC=CAM_ASM_000868 /TAXON_ID=225041 /ORGANISM="Chlamydomonas chlamydogama, Strain SAG 11-48b" /LENGTH=725 /DNA_ID=CAMNT_0049599831 /DNA_START=187 /DNA_END=2361 /DNA_ORIENTATION=-